MSTATTLLHQFTLTICFHNSTLVKIYLQKLALLPIDDSKCVHVFLSEYLLDEISHFHLRSLLQHISLHLGVGVIDDGQEHVLKGAFQHHF